MARVETLTRNRIDLYQGWLDSSNYSSEGFAKDFLLKGVNRVETLNETLSGRVRCAIVLL